MRELFDRHKAKLSDTEDRQVWGAIHDATRGQRPRWQRWGVPVSAIATVATVAIAVVMVNQNPMQSPTREVLLADQTAPVTQAENDEAQGREAVSRDAAKQLAAADETRGSVLGLSDSEPEEKPDVEGSGELSSAVRKEARQRAMEPTPAPAELRLDDANFGNKTNVGSKNQSEPTVMDKVETQAKRGVTGRTQAPTAHRVSDEELKRLPADTFEEAVGLKSGVVSQSGSEHFRGGRAGEVQHQIDGIPVNDPSTSKDADGTSSAATPAPEGVLNSGPTGRVSAEKQKETIRENETDRRKTLPYPSKPGQPIAVGGDRAVNGAAFDAMFFRHYGVNPFVDAQEDRLATFAVDVDNASYTLTRSYLNRGALPPADAVRVEEFINAFRHNYAPPQGSLTASRRWTPSANGTFGVQLDAAPSPFGEDLTLMRVGIKGREIDEGARKPAVLTFLVDVSGSMNRENRLGLVKRSLQLLLNGLNRDDRVALVVYGSNARIICDATNDHAVLMRAIASLRPEGATNAEEGLRTAYALADRNFKKGYINRVILCADGVANVGRTGPEAILAEIKREARRGIELTTIGFGMGNYNDVLMERLANEADGNYYYVDGLKEARKVFVENLTGTLQSIARQVKIQVEFEPGTVRRYRLLGYENRDVADRDFRNDAVDAGEVGAGHEVTALFEVKMERNAPRRGRLATVRIRYEDPETGRVSEESHALGLNQVHHRLGDADPTFILDAAAAEFAELLRGSYWAKDGELSRVLLLAERASRDLDRPADVEEMVGLVQKAQALWPSRTAPEWRDDIRPGWEPEDDRR